MNAVQTHIPIMEDDIPRDGGMWPEYAATMLICVSAIKNGRICGKLWTFYYKRPRLFRGLDELLFVMEDVMDKAGQPAAWCKTRNWGGAFGESESGSEKRNSPVLRKKRIPARSQTELDRIQGKLCTIPIRVYCRQNASMQGTVQLGKETQCFRSALELLHLLSDGIGRASQDSD